MRLLLYRYRTDPTPSFITADYETLTFGADVRGPRGECVVYPTAGAWRVAADGTGSRYEVLEVAIATDMCVSDRSGQPVVGGPGPGVGGAPSYLPSLGLRRGVGEREPLPGGGGAVPGGDKSRIPRRRMFAPVVFRPGGAKGV